MAKLHKVRIGEETFSARSGQVVLDAALLGGVEIPHDCRAGRCGACIARVKQGMTLGGEARQAGTIHACQARVFSDLSLEVEVLPPVVRVKGKVASLTELADDIVEVVIAPERTFEMHPGQYAKLAFRGYPARAFSPTGSLVSFDDDGQIRFHIKRMRGGRVRGSRVRGGRGGARGRGAPLGGAGVRRRRRGERRGGARGRACGERGPRGTARCSSG